MYNLFLDQKLKKEQKDKEKKRRKSEEEETYRKILNEQLVDKYNERVYNYILDLAQNPRKVVKIQDTTKKIDNCRIEVLKEGYNQTSKKSQTFSFGNFITDREIDYNKGIWHSCQSLRKYSKKYYNCKLSELFKKTLEKFWGDAVELNEGAELTWMRQPHYYMGLYSYTYSAGL